MMIEIESDIYKLAEAILNGEVICIPTDTLYALSCDATNFNAVAELYRIKKRDCMKKLPVFFQDIESVDKVCLLNKSAIKLAVKFWPGKLTMVLPLRNTNDIANNVYVEAATSIAVRISSDVSVLKLLQVCKVPLIGTSANISGEKNIRSYNELSSQLYTNNILCNGKIKCFHTLEFQTHDIKKQSTIVGFEGEKPVILRNGAISSWKIMNAVTNNM